MPEGERGRLMRAIGVILNPRASGNRHPPSRIESFRGILGEREAVRAARSEAELMHALASFEARGIETLAICGGDGTVSYVLTRALGVWGEKRMPRVLLLRGGTINNLAHSLGMALRRPERVLAAAVAAHRDGNEIPTATLDLMRVNGSGYGYTVGAGMIVRFLDLYYQARRPGPAVAVALLARLGASYVLRTAAIERLARPVTATITCDGEQVSHTAYTLLLASTIPHLGIGAKPFHRAGNGTGKFHLLAGASTPGELFRRLPKFYAGYASGLSTLHDGDGVRARIEFAEPQAIMINGDVLDTPVDVLEIEKGPRVRMVCC